MRKGKDKIIDGVCSGISEYLGFDDPIWIRIIFVFGGFGAFYLLMMFIMEEPKYENNK